MYQVAIERYLPDQPNLADCVAFQSASTEKAPKVLVVVARNLGSCLNCEVCSQEKGIFRDIRSSIIGKHQIT